MSRRMFETDEGTYIVCGWDSPTTGFFADVYSSKLAYDTGDDAIKEFGIAPVEVKTLDELTKLVKIPANIQILLKFDYNKWLLHHDDIVPTVKYEQLNLPWPSANEGAESQ